MAKRPPNTWSKRRPDLSLFTDASFDPRRKLGTWAFWCRGNKAFHEGGGILKGAIKSSNEAEIKAIVNSVHYLINNDVLQQGDSVLIQTDSVVAVKFYMHSFRHASLCEVRDRFDALIADYNIEYQIRHVKGHVTAGEARHYVNNRCDAIAKHFLQQARKRYA